MPQVKIGQNVIIRNAIIDRGCLIPDGTQIGVDAAQDKQNGFRLTEKGRVLVTPDMLGQTLHKT